MHSWGTVLPQELLCTHTQLHAQHCTLACVYNLHECKTCLPVPCACKACTCA